MSESTVSDPDPDPEPNMVVRDVEVMNRLGFGVHVGVGGVLWGHGCAKIGQADVDLSRPSLIRPTYGWVWGVSDSLDKWAGYGGPVVEVFFCADTNSPSRQTGPVVDALRPTLNACLLPW